MPISSTAFNDLVQKELYENTISNNPQPLYHYTNFETFKNILNSESLWLTDVRFVNDASEYTHGLKIITDTLNNYQKEEEYKGLLPPNFSNANRQILKEQLDVVTNNLRDHSQSLEADITKGNLFIFCLSPEPDQQTQWTNYAGEGGVAIGFNTQVLRHSTQFKYGLSEGISLLKCLYQKHEQEEIIKKVITIYIEGSCGLEQGDGSISSEGLIANLTENDNYWLMNNLRKLAPLLKSPYYKQEQEYRVIASVYRRSNQPTDGFPIGVRTQGNNQISYYNFTYNRNSRPHVHWKYLPDNNKDAQPINFKHLITDIWLGPGRNQSTDFDRLEAYVREYVGDHCQVHKSDSPHRYS